MVKHKQEQYDRKIYHGLVTQLRKKNDHRYTFVIRQVHWSNKSNWEVYEKKLHNQNHYIRCHVFYNQKTRVCLVQPQINNSCNKRKVC